MLDDSYWTKSKQLIAMEHAIHYKSGKPKILIEKVGDGLNEFPNIPIPKEPEQQKTENKVNRTHLEILKDPEAKEQERVSAVMRIKELHENWTAENIADFIAEKNEWKDYNPAETRNKIEIILNSYADKPNPNKKETVVAYSGNPKLKDFTYYKKLKKDKRYLVEEFIYPKTLTMLFSPPAGFKSILALAMAILMTAGKNFLDLKTKNFPVLLCDKENSEQDIKDRWEKIRKGHGIRKEKYPLWIMQDGNLDIQEFIDYLKQTIKEKKIKLIIFDTLHRFSNYQENKADDINRIYTTVFQPIKENLDCSIMFLHHTTKEGGYRGSSDFLGMVDCAYNLVRKGKSNSFELICEKNRRGEINKRYGEIEFNEENIEIIHVKEEEKDTEQNTKFTEVVKKIGELYSIKGDSWKRKDIFSQFAVFRERDGIDASDSTVKRALDWLLKTNALQKNENGEYARNWEKEFSLWQKQGFKNENVGE